MQKINPCIWFDTQAGDAATFYVGIFKNSKILDTSYYSEGMHKPAGTVLTVRFILDGCEFMALNGGPEYKLTPAISFVANCEDQAEVDQLWEKLSAGGTEIQCGWVTDKFGVCWQVVPKGLIELITSPDKPAVQRALAAMMQMKKLDINVMRRAFENK